MSDQNAEAITLKLSIPKKTLRIFGFIILGLIGLELLGQGLRIAKHVLFPTPEDPLDVCNHPNEATCDEQPFQVELAASGRPDGKGLVPNYHGDWITINSLGFRGEEFAVEKPEGTYRVALVGSSTVFGNGLRDDQIIAAYLQEELEERLGQPVEVINGGQTASNSSKNLDIIAHKILEYDPDIIILLTGRNDIYFGLDAGWQPDYLPPPMPRPVEEIETQPEKIPFRLTRAGKFLVNEVMIARAIDRVVTHVAYFIRSKLQKPTPAPTITIPTSPRFVMNDEAISLYEKNMKRIAHLVSSEGVDLIFVVQPTMAATNKPLTDAEQAYVEQFKDEGWYELLVENYPRGIEATFQAGEATGTPTYDLSTIFDDVEEATFLEEPHLNQLGSQIVAERLADIIIELQE